MTRIKTEDVELLLAKLREEARQEEAAHKMMADAKTARQTDRDDAWTDAGYDWLRAEQTTRWQAADTIERLREENARFRSAAIDAKLARLNWQKYNGEQSNEVVYQAEKMASAIDEISAALTPSDE